MTSKYVQQLLRNKLGEIQDNLYRAERSANAHNLDKPWGASGQTLRSIIEGYRAQLDECEREIAAASQEPSR